MLSSNDVRNMVILDGHLAEDPKVKALVGGKKVANIVLATNEYRKNDAGQEPTKVADFHDVTAWGQNAEYAEKFLKKGSRVRVVGKLRSNRKNQTDEKTYYNTFVEAQVLDGIQRLGGEEKEE
jgi:single-strand DNA-binding protein